MRYLTSNTRKIKAHSAVIDVILICRRGKYIVIIQSYYCSCEQKDFLDNYPSVCYTSLLRFCHFFIVLRCLLSSLHFSTGFQWDLICAFQRASQPTSSSFSAIPLGICWCSWDPNQKLRSLLHNSHYFQAVELWIASCMAAEKVEQTQTITFLE